MPILPPKKVQPPPKEPGTHTNAEVKEALHARALRRTVVVTALVFLLIGCLAVVSSTAQEYEGPEDTTSQPKAVIIVADKLTPFMVDAAVHSNKGPFTRLLNSTGGLYGVLSAKYDAAGSALVKLLTGSASSTASTLQGATSFLSALKKAGKKPVVMAPASYWSSNQVVESGSGECTRVGFFDSECTGTECPAEDERAYCNAFYKIISCDGKAQLYRDDIIKGFEKTLELSADAYYVQLTNFVNADVEVVDYSNVLQMRSEVNLLDGAVGQIAMALAERTRALKENWMIIVMGSGDTEEGEAPLTMAAYSRGQLLQLNNVLSPGLTTADVYGTVLRWFGISKSSTNLIGICTDGINAGNCKGKQ